MRSARGKAMNLNASPTTEQLQQLLAQHDDRAGDHILWVDDKGDVHLSQTPRNLTADAHAPLPEEPLYSQPAFPNRSLSAFCAPSEISQYRRSSDSSLDR